MANAACSKSNPPKSRPKVQSSGGGSSSGVRSIQPSGGTSYMLPSGDVSWFSFEARPASSADRTSFFRGIPSSSSLRHGPLQVPQNFIGGWPSSVRSIRPSGGTCYVRESGSASWFSSKASSVPTVRASCGASRRRKQYYVTNIHPYRKHFICPQRKKSWRRLIRRCQQSPLVCIKLYQDFLLLRK